MRAAGRKHQPRSLRVPEADGASLRGRWRTDFVHEAAVRAAEELLMERTLIRMSPAGFAAFRAAIEAPAKPVEEMVELLRRPALWELEQYH